MSDFSTILNTRNDKDEESWISISDMMTGLMMIFLFIAIIYIQEIRMTFGELDAVRERICSQLETEFSEDKKNWNMSICEGGLLVKFNNDGFFLADSPELTEEFKTLLRDFYPRFKKILWKHIDSIEELRIEGHASSEAKGRSKLDAYIYNTELSQGRSFNVMNFVLSLYEINKSSDFLFWSYNNLTAHGMSSSELILSSDGIEDAKASRRVDIRIRAKAEATLLDLIKEEFNEA